MRTSDTLTDLVAALAKARAAFKPVVRDATGQVGQNRSYRYADLATVIDATHAALAKEALVVLQAVDAETSTLITRLAHASGQWVEAAYPLHGYERPQEYGSQLTYARRYSLLALLSLAQEDDDGQAAQDGKPAQARRPEPSPDLRQPAPPEPKVGPAREGLIDECVYDSGKKGTRAWERWRLVFSTGEKATTFDTRLGQLAEQAHAAGDVVCYITKVEPKGIALVSLELVQPF